MLMVVNVKVCEQPSGQPYNKRMYVLYVVAV